MEIGQKIAWHAACDESFHWVIKSLFFPMIYSFSYSLTALSVCKVENVNL